MANFGTVNAAGKIAGKLGGVPVPSAHQGVVFWSMYVALQLAQMPPHSRRAVLASSLALRAALRPERNPPANVEADRAWEACRAKCWCAFWFQCRANRKSFSFSKI